MEHRIPRTGFPPVLFSGEVIAEALPPPPEGRGQWHELKVYRTDGGRLALHVAFRSTWFPRRRPDLKEPDFDAVYVFDKIEELPELLQKHRPKIAEYCRVHPKAPPRELPKQQLLIRTVEFMYDDLANKLTTAASPGERID